MRRSTRRSSMAVSVDSSIDSDTFKKINTRRSSIVAPIEESRNLVGNFSTKFSMSSFVKKVEELTHSQRTAIENVGFGNLLRIPHQTLRKNLLVEWMDRWDCDKRAFLLLGREITINPIDVALILGLPVTGQSVILNEDEPFSELEEEFGASVTNRKITVSSVERRLESLGDAHDEEFIRTFLLFAFGTFLFHNSNAKIDSRYISLLRDLDKVSGYAWGIAVLEDLFNWLSRRKEEEAKNMEGCLILLQFWSFEHIDIGRPNLVDCTLGFPRACRWESSRCNSSRQWFVTKFNELEENQVIWKLQVAEAESDFNVIRESFEGKIRGNEVDTLPEPISIPKAVDVNTSMTTRMASSTQCMGLPPKSVRKVAVLHEEPKRNMGRGKRDIQDEVSEISQESVDKSEITVDYPECSSSFNTQEVQENHTAETSHYVKEDYLVLKSEYSKLEQDMTKFRKENAMLRNQLTLNPSLEEEIAKLRKEVSDLKEENQQLRLSANAVGNVERLIFEYFDGVQDASEAK